MDDEEELIEGEDIPEESGEEAEDGAYVDPRVERIEQHVDDSLQLDDALQATVGAASGDLLLLQYRFRQALDETLQQEPPSLTALAEVMPAVNMFTKITQQADRFIQLSLKIKSAKKAS